MKLSPKAAKSLQTVVDRFKAGDLSPIIDVARMTLPTDAPAAQWTMSNRILAYAQSGDLDCRGFRQWQKAGRQVKKGGWACFILTPREVYETDKVTGDKKLKWTYFRTVPVFGIGMTQGEPVEYPGAPRDPPPLAQIAAALGIDVKWKPLIDVLGTWSAYSNEIELGTDDIPTFFHELAHAVHTHLGHTKQLTGQDPHRETIAEFSACVLAHLYGQGDRTGNAWRYIKGYNKDPLTAITKALSEVSEILECIEELAA